jgi:hypothetical protein
MLKFQIKTIPTENENDCWAIALSQALNVKYDKIYKLFKHFINADGSLSTLITQGYLQNNGFTVYNVDNSLKDVLRVYNRKNGIVIAMTDKIGGSHIVYIEGLTIYESKDLTNDMLWWYITEYNVDWIAIKLENYE